MINCGPLWILAFLTGFSASAHCMAMCGTLIPALSHPFRDIKGAGPAGWLNLGRLAGYSLAGALVGASAQTLWATQPLLFIGVGVRLLVSLALLLLAFRLWRGVDDRLTGTIGRFVWKWVGQALLPAQKLPYPLAPICTGLIWALLPCGMVYSMLLMALSSGSASQGALLLACFGLGTLPAIGTMSLGFKRWNGHSGFKTQLARRMVAGLAGLWALFSLYSLTVSAPLQHIH